MDAVADIRSSLDLNQIAQYLGTSPEEAGVVVDEALSSLVGQLDSNVSDASGAVGLAGALGKHVSSPAYDDRIDLERIDVNDGEKIVSHVYSPTQVQSLGGGLGGPLVQKLLPLLAPIVMAYLAKKLNGYLGGAAGQAMGQADQPGRGGLGDILGDLLGGALGGGGGQAQQQRPSSGGLTDILGDLLGGGAAPQSPAVVPGGTGGTGGTGGFRSPSAPATDLNVGATPGGSQGTPAGTPTQPAGNPGDLLGGILSDLLRGRR